MRIQESAEECCVDFIEIPSREVHPYDHNHNNALLYIMKTLPLIDVTYPEILFSSPFPHPFLAHTDFIVNIYQILGYQNDYTM